MTKDDIPIPTAAMADPVPQASSGEPAIEVVGLKKVYSTGLIFKTRHQALQDVTLKVNRGEIFGLLGPNGAGKTTFLKIMLGIIRKTAGTATMLGYPAGSKEGRRRVGYLPEHLRVSRHLTGYQALELFGNLSGVATNVIREKRGELLELVGLSQRAKDSVKQYSKGMLQRLGLAQALLHDPELLVLDEPTDGLDPRARAEMRQIIRDLQKRGVTIFLNSHLLQEVEMICQRVAILDKGNVRYCGDVATIGQTLGETGVTSGKLVVDFTLKADQPAVLDCLQSHSPKLQEITEGLTKVRLSLGEQAEVDQAIDRLRSAQLSIVAVEPQRISLEDAFLELVNEESFKN